MKELIEILGRELGIQDEALLEQLQVSNGEHIAVVIDNDGVHLPRVAVV